MTVTPEELERRQVALEERHRLIVEMVELTSDLERHSNEKTLALAASAAPRGSTGGMASRMAATSRRASASPSAGGRSSASNVTLTAAASGGNTASGSLLESSDQLAELTVDVLRQLEPGRSSEPRRARIAQARWDYPEERQLGLDSTLSNTAKLDKVCGIGAGRYDQSGALVATGGICLPVNVDYAVQTWSTADRPLRDGLPAFQASRGGIRFVTPPDIGVPSLAGTASGAGLSVGIWTEATDASPAGATKPVWTVACGAEQLVYVNAVSTRVQFGNMEARFAPEQVASNTQQAIAVSARQAELELLTLMYSASFVKEVSIGTQYLGAVRDVLSAVDLLKRQYLDGHRIPKTAAFTAVFPAWAMDMFKADLLRETAHDNAGPRDVLAVTDDQVDDLFRARGVNVIWTLEGLKAGTYGNVTIGTTQQFPIFTTGNTPQWPGQTSSGAFELAWLLYVEGTYQFLDGGRLDLGVVRDSLLDSTNDYETFVEVFEAVAGRGIDAYGVVQTILPTGGSAGTVAATSYHE